MKGQEYIKIDISSFSLHVRKFVELQIRQCNIDNIVSHFVRGCIGIYPKTKVKASCEPSYAIVKNWPCVSPHDFIRDNCPENHVFGWLVYDNDAGVSFFPGKETPLRAYERWVSVTGNASRFYDIPDYNHSDILTWEDEPLPCNIPKHIL